MNKVIESLIIAVMVTVTEVSYGQSIPQGFEAVIKDNSVQVYQKNEPNGKQQYVTVVNLVNATINNLTGEVVNTHNGIKKKIITELWRDAVTRNTYTKKVRVVINADYIWLCDR
jgi:hypothetical protein